jgi:hypothetical protein
MQYIIRPSQSADEWVVEATDGRRNGEIYLATFSGPRAEERAMEYVALKEESPYPAAA